MMFVLQVKIKVFFIRLKKKKKGKEKENGSVHKNRKWLSRDLKKIHICPKVTKMGSIIGHKIDYNEVGVLRGQWHIPSKNLPKYPPSGKQNLKCIIRYNIECCRKYIGQIYTDSLVHDEKVLKLLVDTIGQVKSSVTFWL